MAGMYINSKKFRFETAHRLAKGYPCKCKNIHGHSWNGELKVAVESGLDQYDFAIDFGEMKPFLKGLEDMLDHGIILHEEDVELIELCEKSDWKVVVLPANPTCEVLAAWIFHQAVEAFKEFKHVKVHSVVIEETCTSRCEYYG